MPNGCPEYATTWYAWTRKLDDGDDGIFEWRVSDVLTVSAEQEAQQGLSPAAEAIREDAILDGNLQEVEPIVDGNIREEVILDGNNNGGAVSPINDGTTILDGNIKEEAILDGNIREEVILDGNNAAVVRDLIKFRRSRRELLPDYYGRADPRPSRARTRRRGPDPRHVCRTTAEPVATAAAVPPPPPPPNPSPPPTGTIIPPGYSRALQPALGAEGYLRVVRAGLYQPVDGAACSGISRAGRPSIGTVEIH